MEDNLVDQATKAAERLEAANKRMEELVKKQEELEAKRILSGKSEAGMNAPQMSEEEKLKMEIKAYFKGTSIGQALK